MANSTEVMLSKMKPCPSEGQFLPLSEIEKMARAPKEDPVLDQPELTVEPSMVDILMHCLNPSPSKKAEKGLK